MEHAAIPAKNVGAKKKDTKMKQHSKINSEEVINDANQPKHDGGGQVYTK